MCIRDSDIYFDAGTQVLRGQQALNYVRERSQLSANADIGRMKRQQAFVASMINKVISANTLTKPYRVYNFVEAATRSITPDPELASLDKLAKLARQFRETDLDDIEFITVPFMSYEPDPNRLVWAPEADELWERIIADQPLNKKLSGQVVTADDPVAALRNEYTRLGRVSVPALTTLLIIEAMNACCRFIRPMSEPLPRSCPVSYTHLTLPTNREV